MFYERDTSLKKWHPSSSDIIEEKTLNLLIGLSIINSSMHIKELVDDETLLMQCIHANTSGSSNIAISFSLTLLSIVLLLLL